MIRRVRDDPVLSAPPMRQDHVGTLRDQRREMIARVDTQGCDHGAQASRVLATTRPMPTVWDDAGSMMLRRGVQDRWTRGGLCLTRLTRRHRSQVQLGVDQWL
ncbi:MAG: hypothetical protein ACT4P7_10655 [Gemmatimonadaceae bacterium]